MTHQQPHAVGGVTLLQVLCCLQGAPKPAGKPGMMVFFSSASLVVLGIEPGLSPPMPSTCSTPELHLYPNISCLDDSSVAASPLLKSGCSKIQVSGSASETIKSDAFRPFIGLS